MQSGVIILAHGSRHESEVQRVLAEVSAKVKGRLPPGIEVVWAALQFNHPNMEEAIDLLVKQGIKRMVIMPYFLFDGRHPSRDIPGYIEAIRRTNPGVEFVLANTLGVGEQVIDLVLRRILEASPELSPRYDFSGGHNAPYSIEARSMAIIEGLLPALDCSEEERQVIMRLVHTSGDPQLARLVKLHPKAIPMGIAALRQGKPIFTDVRMVAAGINRYLAQKTGSTIICALEEWERIKPTPEESATRTAAALRLLGRRLNGAIVAVGNAPTALLALLELIDGGEVLPALTVGVPVGFVQAKEAKEELIKRDIPYITILGTRGGSALAAAAVNALLKIAVEGKENANGEESHP